MNMDSKFLTSKNHNIEVMIPISAKKDNALRENVRALYNWIKTIQFDKLSEQEQHSWLSSLAYTLQLGRHHFSERYLVIVNTIHELEHALAQFDSQIPQQLDIGFVKDIENPITNILSESELNNVFNDLTYVARLWVNGQDLPWKRLYPGTTPKRLQIPSYQFEKRKMHVQELPAKIPQLTIQQEDRYHNKATEFYSLGAEPAITDFREEYLTFAPFQTRRKGFSMTGFFLGKHMPEGEWEYVLEKQRELRQVLFYKEIFTQLHSVLDIGCGHGTDVIQIADAYPQVRIDGFTITASQAQLGNKRLQQKKLEDRVRIHHADSSFDPFPSHYDLAFGIEVTFHIRNKMGVFGNIANALNDNGRLLLMDYIANLRGEIIDKNVEITIPTMKSWAEYLANNNLWIDEIIDVSPEISNFLYDPELEKNISDLEKVAQDTLRNYANQSIALDKGWISYCLFKISKKLNTTWEVLLKNNLFKLEHKRTYTHALNEMLDNKYIPYPQNKPIKKLGISNSTQSPENNSLEIFFKKTTAIPISTAQSSVENKNTYLILGNSLRKFSGLLQSSNVLLLDDNPVANIDDTLLQVFDYLKAVVAQEKNSFYLHVVLGAEEQQRGLEAISALVSSLAHEVALCRTQTLTILDTTSDNAIIDAVLYARTHIQHRLVRYTDNRYTCETLIAAHTQDNHQMPANIWQHEGVYVVIGGLGGLGRVWLEFANQHMTNAQIFIIGRRPLQNDDIQYLQHIEKNKLCIQYLQADLGNYQQLWECLDKIITDHGHITGVIHAAGVTRDSLLVNKKSRDVMAVLKPKIQGTQHLYNIVKKLPVGWCVFFSSISGTFGNAGQTDYALANAFIDLFIAGTCHENNTCKFHVIAWPFINNGKMDLSSTSTKIYSQLGFTGLDARDFIRVMESAITSNERFHLPLKGNPDIYRHGPLYQYFHADFTAEIHTAKNIHVAETVEHDDVVSIKRHLLKLFVSSFHLRKDDITENTPFDVLGLDSIKAVSITEEINQKFQMRIPTSTIFEFNTIEQLAAYLDKTLPNNDRKIIVKAEKINVPNNNNDKEKLKIKLFDLILKTLKFHENDVDIHTAFSVMGINSINTIEIIEKINQYFNTSLPTSVMFEFNDVDALADYILPVIDKDLWIENHVVIQRESTGKLPESDTIKNTIINNAQIAIIGMACQASGVNNPDELWDVVSRGKVCTTPIVNQTWRALIDEYCPTYHQPVYGSLENPYDFDAEFFNISPKEAESMDPAQRLVLENVYTAFENAGYAPMSLGGKNIGVILGSMGSTAVAPDLSHHSMLGSETSVLAGRIAYFFNFKGPALVVNTACSSSLVAIDIASKKLRHEECDMVIAGGATIYTHPSAFVSMHKANMLSKNGECRPFDNKADGILVGDGIGILVLKRLADAIQQNDTVYAVLKASDTNQDGKTSAITVPSFLSQSQLIQKIYTQNHINPEDIGYIECHGTGTKLGDPIEIHALTDAFRQFTHKTHFCAIGSLKANLGHTSAASGVLSLIKVVMAIRHQQIPPATNFSQPNSHIDFEKSPVYVNSQLTNWNANKNNLRQAGISSFGFSGTNAHLVIEEFTYVQKNYPSSKFVVLPISAPSKNQLVKRVQDLFNYVVGLPSSIDTRLTDMEFTLQKGRDSFLERIIFITRSFDDLKSQFNNYLCGILNNSSQYFTVDKTTIADFKHNDINCFALTEETVTAIISWIENANSPWLNLHHQQDTKRISLPTYPFDRKTFKKPALDIKQENSNSNPLNYMVHKNISNFEKIAFSSQFNGQEEFFIDHKIQNKKIFPAVAYLELACQAFQYSLPAHSKLSANNAMVISNVGWVAPLIADDNAGTINVYTDFEYRQTQQHQNISCAYNIFSGTEKRVLHNKGYIRAIHNPETPYIDLATLKKLGSAHDIQAHALYDYFSMANVNYGKTHQCIQDIYYGNLDIHHNHQNFALARLSTSFARNIANQYIIHHGLTDCALQVSVALAMSLHASQTIDTKITPVPFALETIEIFSPATENLWAYVRFSEGEPASPSIQNIDIDLCDDNGKIISRITKLSVKSPDLPQPYKTVKSDQQPYETRLLEAHWATHELTTDVAQSRVFEQNKMKCHWVFIELDKQTIFSQLLKNNPAPADIVNINICHLQLENNGSQYIESANYLLNYFKNNCRNIIEPILVQVIFSQHTEPGIFAGLSALMKCVHQENRNIFGQVLDISKNVTDSFNKLNDLDRFSAFAKTNINQHYLFFKDKTHYTTQHWSLINNINIPLNMPWKNGGNYLITGGAGGLAQGFGEEILGNIFNGKLFCGIL